MSVMEQAEIQALFPTGIPFFWSIACWNWNRTDGSSESRT